LNLKTFWKILIGVAAVLVLAVVAGIAYYSVTFPKVGPAADIKISATPEMLQRGEYLVNHVAVCIDCHSTHDPTKYGMPIVPGTIGKGGEDFAAFVKLRGTLESSNITSAALKDWTDGEVLRAVTEGVAKDGKALFPMMPYMNYGTLDRSDIESIIAYVRTLAPVENQTPPTKLPFPLNIIIPTIPRGARFAPRPDTTDLVAHGKYLATMASCGECHSQRVRGEIPPGLEWAGGMEFELPFGVVRSANLTPDRETGIGHLSKDDFIAKFKSYSPGTFVPAEVGLEGANTVMPWMLYSGMTDYDLGAIFEYLKTLTPVKNEVTKITLKPAAAE
jgi:mono/diheme cytochrome c family protein